MEITGAFTWNMGTMSGTGKKALQGEAEIMNSAVLNEGTLENSGTVIWKSGDIHLHNGATIHNLSGATFVDQRTGKYDIRHDNSGQLERFINEGTFIKSGPPFTDVNVAFDNSGTVEVQSGTLG
ncbi:hypothetical protein GC175_33830, partial [bacterium]|nr:hypothetical protein [bacterium]